MPSFLDRFRDPAKKAEREQVLAEERTAAEAARLAAEASAKAEAVERRRRDEELKALAEWQYREQTDEMRGTTMRFAELTSENVVETPYGGRSQLRIVVRITSGNYEVLLLLLGGMFEVPYNGIHTFSTKADKLAIREWTANEPEHNNYDVLFVSNPRQFVKSFADAELLFIEIMLHDLGRQQFKFNPLGLDYDFR